MAGDKFHFEGEKGFGEGFLRIGKTILCLKAEKRSLRIERG